jgi:hypothetical protein
LRKKSITGNGIAGAVEGVANPYFPPCEKDNLAIGSWRVGPWRKKRATDGSILIIISRGEITMSSNKKLLFASASALMFCGTLASTAHAAGLKCECTDLNSKDCLIEKGRADVPFSYDPKNMGGAYDALEAKAMKDADDEATTKGEAARKKWESSGVQCPQPCDATPEFWMKHGPPFAGAGGMRPGYGEGRSVWKVSYICKKVPPPPPPAPRNGGGGPGLFLGFGGIGINIGSGGYCDQWGCPGDYWDEPVWYGPVYFDGEWYEGPVYYREHHGHHEYWVHGGWHEDEWQGERPNWAEGHVGPALGRDYYKSDEFRHWKENHHEGDKGRGEGHGEGHDQGHGEGHDQEHNHHDNGEGAGQGHGDEWEKGDHSGQGSGDHTGDHGTTGGQGSGDWQQGDHGGKPDQSSGDHAAKGDQGSMSDQGKGHGDQSGKSDKHKNDKAKGDKDKGDNSWPH